jgi:hypothetical protein
VDSGDSGGVVHLEQGAMTLLRIGIFLLLAGFGWVVFSYLQEKTLGPLADQVKRSIGLK